MNKDNNIDPAVNLKENNFQISTREEYSLPKILIVDDEPRVLRSLHAALRFKYDVTIAKNAFQAQEIMQTSEHFDVVVSDERMPKLSGHNFLQWAKVNFPNSVRIMLTSSDFDSISQSLDTADVYKYLSKPWNIKELEGVLEKAALKSQLLVNQALKEEFPGIFEQCIIAVLDPDSRYHDSYQQLAQDVEGVSNSYFFYSVNEIIHSITQIQGIGILFLDLAAGEEDIARVIREVNKRYPSISIFVTAKPAMLTSFISSSDASLDYQYITKPMSLTRIQPLMLAAVEKYNL